MSANGKKAPPPLPIGTIVGGQYRIEGELGAGAMGAVFVAEDMRLHRAVAVKTLKPELLDDPEQREMFMKRFEQEAVLAANITHPSILAIYNVGEHEGVLWYAMEYIAESKTLSNRLKEAVKAGEFLPLDAV